MPTLPTRSFATLVANTVAGIQGRASALVASIDGDFYTVMGFPLGRFVRALAGLGFRIPSEN